MAALITQVEKIYTLLGYMYIVPTIYIAKLQLCQHL